MQRFFIKIPAHSDFQRGIWIPYATQLEAERQVANDLLSTDFVEGIYSAEVVPVKGGLPGQILHKDRYPVHVHENEQILSIKGIQKEASRHLEDMHNERVVAIAEQTAQIVRVTEAMRTGELDKLSPEDQALGARLGYGPQNVAGAPGFKVVTGGTATAGPIALAAATAKTILGIAAGSVSAPTLASFGWSFDGVTQSAVPVLCEPVSGTNATNPPGTNSTSMTPKQIRGWSKGGPSSTGAYNWTAEPTVLEVYDKILLTPAGGVIAVQFPLDREPSGIVTATTQFKFMGIRLTAPAAVNCHGSMEIDE